jgi:hypothetical protein
MTNEFCCALPCGNNQNVKIAFQYLLISFNIFVAVYGLQFSNKLYKISKNILYIIRM